MARTRALLEKQRPGANEPDLRSFDWRYLWEQCQPTELFTLTNAALWSFALSPDGAHITYSTVETINSLMIADPVDALQPGSDRK